MTELMNAYTVMSLCRLKLNQYHEILEQVVPSDNVEAQQALTGIHEVHIHLFVLSERRDLFKDANSLRL